MLLSIGMIVKNEEKHLERCLKALLPLKNKITYEVVIVDTGSTDKTKEIAHKYTDKVYDFEWINDFAAARNYGLKKCTGKWYMFLDADEEIDDCQPLIDFLLSRESEKYNSITFNFKNYTDETYTNCNIAILGRLFRNKDIKFVNKIHETIVMHLPLYNLNCQINHYGYTTNGEAKYKRNNAILDEVLAEDPNNLNLLCYKVEGLYVLKKYDDVIETYKSEKEVCRTRKDQLPGFVKIASYTIRTYLHTKQYDKMREVLLDLNSKLKEKDLALLDVYFTILSYYNSLDLDNNALRDRNIENYTQEYERILNKYHNHKYSSVEMTVFTQSYIDYQYLFIVKLVLAKHYYAINQIEEMNIILNSMYVKGNVFIHLKFDLERIKERRDFSRIKDIYLITKNENIYNEFALLLIKFSEENGILSPILQALFEIKNKIASPFKEYLSIVIDKETKDDIKYFENLENVNSTYSNVLYYLIKKKVNIDNITWLSIPDKQEKYAKQYAKNNKDSFQIMLEYIQQKDNIPNIRLLGLYCHLLYYVLSMNKESTDKDYLYLLKKYISWQLNYANCIYKAELFIDESIDLLPTREQYCYYLDKAISLLNKESYKDAIGYIRLAMKSEETLIRGCKLLLPKVEEKKETEFDAYAKKVKEIIIGLINSGKRNEAFTVYQQYKKVNPKDTELDQCFKN